MAKLLSDQTASELPAIFEAVRNISQATRGRPIRRDRGGTGGTGSRSYVIITAVTSPSEYIGNIITSPDDSTVIDTAVTIKVKNATANEFIVGYDDWADNVDDDYWIDGTLLG